MIHNRQKLGLPSLEYRRDRLDLVQVYKFLNDIDKVDMGKLFTMSNYGSARGHPKKCTKIDPDSISVRTVLATELLMCGTILMAPSVNALKSRLNNHWEGYSNKFLPACYVTGTTTGQRKYILNASLQVL